MFSLTSSKVEVVPSAYADEKSSHPRRNVSRLFRREALRALCVIRNMILVVSSSLRADSNSRVLAREAQRVLEQDRRAVVPLDLRDHPLPLCDGGPSYEFPGVAVVARLVERADAILVATPIYNYDANAAVKNLIKLTGEGWNDKPVGFLCAAGGMGSYMSIMALANCLMLDFRSVIVPRFVYATGESFADGRIVDAEVSRRVADLARATARLGGLLRSTAADGRAADREDRVAALSP
jgi:NAD(P)H-dependent FMN reductase